MIQPQSALDLASQVRRGQVSAVAQVERCLARIAARDGALNACTRILEDRALEAARRVDAGVAGGADPGPLAGVPFGAKDLFDIAGLPTTAGAAMRLAAPPAALDAEAIRRLEAAGAILVATCNMDALAYGFVTVNAHHGTTRNPHDLARLAGGSSGGSAAGVAGGLFPLALGSDTNGSIRIPAALCGVYGLKPTHGALPMAGVFPFVDSFDDIGPFAGTCADLALAWQVLAGLPTGGVGAARELRVGRLTGYFARGLDRELAAGIDRVCAELGPVRAIDLPEVARARSAAYLMTAAEGAAAHLADLRRDPLAFDPAVRDRLLAGALLPHALYVEATRLRELFRRTVLAVFDEVDVLIAPSAPGVAPLVDEPMIELDGVMVPARANLGLFTQPLSFIGLPVVAVPLARPGRLPLGLQLVGPPGGEAACFALAARLEACGLTGASPPPGW